MGAASGAQLAQRVLSVQDTGLWPQRRINQARWSAALLEVEEDQELEISLPFLAVAELGLQSGPTMAGFPHVLRGANLSLHASRRHWTGPSLYLLFLLFVSRLTSTCKCLVCIYVHRAHVCLVPSDVRSVCQGPWNRDYGWL